MLRFSLKSTVLNYSYFKHGLLKSQLIFEELKRSFFSPVAEVLSQFLKRCANQFRNCSMSFKHGARFFTST